MLEYYGQNLKQLATDLELQEYVHLCQFDLAEYDFGIYFSIRRVVANLREFQKFWKVTIFFLLSKSLMTPFKPLKNFIAPFLLILKGQKGCWYDLKSRPEMTQNVLKRVFFLFFFSY